MGLKNRTTNGVYVKLKDGKFYLAKDETNTPFDELEGLLVDLYLKDETYEGQTQRKLYLVMSDGDDNYIIGLRLDSRYATNFLTFVKNIDLKEPFSLCPTYREKTDAKGETVKESGLLLKQDGSFAKAFYSKDHPNGLPQMRQVKLNGKVVWDKTDMLEFYEGVIEKELKPALPKKEHKNVILNDEVSEGEDAPIDADEVEVSKLPWEE